MLGSGVVVGFLLGVVITGFSYGAEGATDLPGIEPGHRLPAVIASGKVLGIVGAVAEGIVVGVIAARSVRSHPLSSALAANLVTAASSVATIDIWQVQRGRWPIGTIDGIMIVVAPALLCLVCSAGLLAAIVVSVRQRRAA